MVARRYSHAFLLLGSLGMTLSLATSAMAAADPGKKACFQDARVLCPAAMRTLSRKKVEACMVANIDKTSPTCKAAMLKIKAEREAKARKPA